jgi:hypothetical protein
MRRNQLATHFACLFRSRSLLLVAAAATASEYVKRAPGSFLDVSQSENVIGDDDKQFTEVMKRQNN